MMKNQQTFKELNVMVDRMKTGEYNQVIQSIEDALAKGLLVDNNDYKLLRRRWEVKKQSMEQREGLGDW